MREILFRGKRRLDRSWNYGDLVHCTDRLVAVSDEQGNFVNVFPETVGQYTGLTDKNGKKIFEGDIVRCISMTDMANMIVIFEDGEFRMVLCEKYKDYISGCGFYAIRCFDKEIIGNIHDNPELLENP